MALISLPFLAFCIAVLLTHLILPARLRPAFLLLASYAFYLTYGWPYALALAALTLANYIIARRIPANPRWLWAGLFINIASFGLLKVLSGPYGLTLLPSALTPAALLPIGYSFYVLQAISYLVDVSRRQITPEPRLVYLALYLAWFPKLLAGPIERAKTFLPQLNSPPPLHWQAIERALGLIMVGLLRKIIIADQLTALRPADLFSQPLNYGPGERILWLFVYAFALYNDFAGYTGIMRGVSALFGIELSPNFRQPFFAPTVTDFWNRWHISLSSWLRDYIFYPLQRQLARHHTPRPVVIFVTPLVTMLASGFWHGAYLSMLLWGGWHGLALGVEQNASIRPAAGPPLKKWGQTLVTFLLITLAWIPFAAPGLGATLQFFTPTLATFPDPFLLPDLLWLLPLSLWLDKQEMTSGDTFFLAWSVPARAWGLAAALFLVLLSAGSAANLSGFVYQGF